MDGITLTRELRELLNEPSGSDYLDSKSTYDYLYEAAVATVQRTSCLTTTQSITTVALQRDYYLNADFLKLYLMDSQNKFFIKYTNTGSSDFFIYPASYDSIILANNETSVAIPSSFCIRDAPALTQLTGTCTAGGSLSGGVATLTDSAALFSTNRVAAGDFIHNTTDGSHGVVVTVTDNTHIITALFGGTENDWDITVDAYKLNLQKRFYLTLDPPPLTASETITVYYVQKPAPVYSDYYAYNIPFSLKGALLKYAAWIYKYRDREPNYGDAWFRFWDMTVRQYGRELNQTRMTSGYKVNFIKRAGRSGSYR